jgi:hypothetical protein
MQPIETLCRFWGRSGRLEQNKGFWLVKPRLSAFGLCQRDRAILPSQLSAWVCSVRFGWGVGC